MDINLPHLPDTNNILVPPRTIFYPPVAEVPYLDPILLPSLEQVEGGLSDQESSVGEETSSSTEEVSPITPPPVLNNQQATIETLPSDVNTFSIISKDKKFDESHLIDYSLKSLGSKRTPGKYLETFLFFVRIIIPAGWANSSPSLVNLNPTESVIALMLSRLATKKLHSSPSPRLLAYFSCFFVAISGLSAGSKLSVTKL